MIAASDLSGAIKLIGHALPKLEGHRFEALWFENSEGTLRLFATDDYRLALQEIASGDKDYAFGISRADLKVLEPFLNRTGQVKITVKAPAAEQRGNVAVTFAFEGEAVLRLSAFIGKPPEWRKVQGMFDPAVIATRMLHFNSKLLGEALQAVSEMHADIEVAIDDDTKPLVITSMAKPGFTEWVMPVRNTGHGQ